MVPVEEKAKIWCTFPVPYTHTYRPIQMHVCKKNLLCRSIDTFTEYRKYQADVVR
jgi:hypothetical protein